MVCSPHCAQVPCYMLTLALGGTACTPCQSFTLCWGCWQRSRTCSCWLDVQDTAKNTLALRSFNDALLHDDRVSVSIIPVGDGMALCRRIPQPS